MNNAAMNLGTQVSFPLLAYFLLCIFSEEGLLNHMVALFSVFIEASTLFFIIAEGNTYILKEQNDF